MNKKIIKNNIYIIIFLFILNFFGNFVEWQELIQQAFWPSIENETILNLWNTKDAVWNSVLRESVGLQDAWLQDMFIPWQWCFYLGQRLTIAELQELKKQAWSNQSDKDFCEKVLWWDQNVSAWSSRAPLIVRITKFLLRITIVLSVTMVLYSGISYIIEASKGADVKQTTNNLMYIVGWVLLALMSLWLINLISSIGASSLNVSF